MHEKPQRKMNGANRCDLFAMFNPGRYGSPPKGIIDHAGGSRTLVSLGTLSFLLGSYPFLHQPPHMARTPPPTPLLLLALGSQSGFLATFMPLFMKMLTAFPEEQRDQTSKVFGK